MMSSLDILQLRLHNHLLSSPNFLSPEEVVAHFGAMQAQDYYGALWSIGMRMRDSTGVGIEKAFNEGKILRTHVMRPTWHFVVPDKIRTILRVTSHRVHAQNAFMKRQLGLDDVVLNKSIKIFETVLVNKNLTRSEISVELKKAGVNALGLLLVYILMYAELEGVITSGPRRGKQFTYALLSERAPIKNDSSFEEDLAYLTFAYFRSHGPAELRDFVWWSGLTIKEAKEGLALVLSQLETVTDDDKTYYFVNAPSMKISRSTLLLPTYDEYTVAYKDRTAIAGELYETLRNRNSILAPVMVVNGNIVGKWTKESDYKKTTLSLSPFTKLSEDERESFQKEIRKYHTFITVKK